MKRYLTVISMALALAAIQGCGPERSEVRLSLYRNAAEEPVPELRVSLRDGLRVEEFTLGGSVRSVGPLETGSAGTLHIDFALLADGVPSETSGSIGLPLKPDWRWGVDFHIAVEDPMQQCFGCFGSRSFELDPALGFDEGLMLWVVWGGNSISNPVVY